jgi:hypothetical protein
VKAIKNTIILFTQFGVNEPTSGGESNLSVPLSIETLITMRFSTRVTRIRVFLILP